MEHDKCRSTTAYPNSGQNLAVMSSSGNYLNDTHAINQMIDYSWFGECKDCPADMVRGYRSTKAVVGHFTAMIQQKSGRVGCAMTKYREKTWFTTLLTCNYSFTNLIGEEIYATGVPCSQCTTGCSTRFPGLCA